jgi:hypothetical protein
VREAESCNALAPWSRRSTLCWARCSCLFRSRSRLQVEILVLRYQLIVLRRTAPKRVRLRAVDRLLFVLLYRLWPGVLDSIAVIQPDTIVRWHRRGFRALWWWKSRRRLGRPGIAKDVRDLIREISRANPLWGAPRVHGELLKLGIDVSQSTVAKYMSKTRRPPSQSWRTFLCNHSEAIASIDLFVVPTRRSHGMKRQDIWCEIAMQSMARS